MEQTNDVTRRASDVEFQFFCCLRIYLLLRESQIDQLWLQLHRQHNVVGLEVLVVHRNAHCVVAAAQPRQHLREANADTVDVAHGDEDVTIWSLQLGVSHSISEFVRQILQDDGRLNVLLYIRREPAAQALADAVVPEAG